MKKKISLSLIVIIVLSMITVVNAGTLSNKKLGIAMDIIDGEALVVQFNDLNMFIKLIGVNTNASQEALQYVNTHVKGKYVWVITEDMPTAAVNDSKYYYGYVYLYDTGEMLNDTLIRQGLAELKTSDSFASKYNDLTSSESYAKSKKIGVWQVNKTKSDYYYSGNSTNINTATTSELAELKGITSTIASNIVNYRKENPFNTIKEIKFVKGMTKDIYDGIYDKITVVTNINVASEDELLTLNNLSQSDVDSIIKYRDRDSRFTSLEQFYTKTDLNSSDYENNRHFISLDYEESTDYRIGDIAININTASSSQIRSASKTLINTSTSDKIVSNRKRGYTYKTLMELLKISNININAETINKLEDNFNLYTNINNASTDELESLFGSNYSSSDISKIKSERPFGNISELKTILGDTKYNAIKDFIYVDKYDEVDRINLNLATESQIDRLSLTSSQLRQLVNKYKDIDYAEDLPFDVKDINNKISLYTNINIASESELATVYNMSSSLISSIISYREEQPFGSVNEIEEFFEDENDLSFYREIKDFIVVR